MYGLPIILALAILHSPLVQGSCKVHDASWINNVKPRITQPTRSEPDKVEIDWSAALRNARCVDSFNIYVWKVGQAQNRGQKIAITDKTTTKQALVIEPCIDYFFAVEFIELDFTHTDQEQSATARFKTEAIPQLMNNDPANFRIQYAFDRNTGTHKVDRASIIFNKNILKHSSCIKHIEITGSIDNSPIGGSSQFGRTGFGQGIGGSSQTGGRGQIGGSTQTGGRGQIGGSTQTGGRGQIGGSTQTGGRGQIGGSSQTGGHGQIGGSTQTGGRGQIGGSSQTGGHGQIGGSSSYPGGNFGWNQHLMPDNYGYSARYPDCPIGGSMQSNQYGLYDPRCYWSQRPDFAPGGQGQGTSRPPYDTSNGGLDWGNGGNNNGLNWNRRKRSTNTRRPNHGGQHDIRQQITPPFNGDFIELEFRIQPCSGYRFDLKIVTPRNAVLGQVNNLRLPKLADVPDFIPPQLSTVFRVSNEGQITLNPNAGIPATCIRDFLQAVDKHMSNIKQGIQYHINQSHLWNQKVHEVKTQQLSTFNCTCQSTYIRINGTSKSAYRDLMGIYHFEGMAEGKPYFKQQIMAGQTQHGSIQENQRVGYLYWDRRSNMWKVGPELRGSNMLFRTSQFSNRNCPADANNLKQWQYSGTLRWKSDPNFAIECLRV